jgi:hypothetical protein
MQVADIKQLLSRQGITVTDEQITEALSEVEMTAEEITDETLPALAKYFAPPKSRRGKGGKLAKSEEAPPAAQPDLGSAIAKSEASDMATQPPVEQGEPVEEIKIEIPAQAIASVENIAVGMVLQIDSEVDAMATSVARLANNAGALFAYKLNQKIGMQSGVNEAESLARHGDAWSASRSRINDLISNIQQGAIAS